MLPDYFYRKLKSVKFYGSTVADYVKVNKQSYVYAFKYEATQDQVIKPKEFIDLFKESELNELSIMFVKSQMPNSKNTCQMSVMRNPNVSTLPGVIIDEFNSRLSYVDTNHHDCFETVYVSSNDKLTDDQLNYFKEIFKNSGISLISVSSDVITNELNTFTKIDSNEMNLTKGSYNEVCFTTNKTSVYSTPLIELEGTPSTALDSHIRLTNLGYRKYTLFAFLKVDKEIIQRSFNGIRVFGALQKFGDPYKYINSFLNELSFHNVEYNVHKDGFGLYQMLIPGMIHTNSLALKLALKDIKNSIDHKFILRQNNLTTLSLSSDLNHSGGDFPYPLETFNQSSKVLDLTRSIVCLSGKRDDSYKSLFSQEVMHSVAISDHTILIDMEDELDMFPLLVEGIEINNPMSLLTIFSSFISSNRDSSWLDSFFKEYGISIDDFKHLEQGYPIEQTTLGMLSASLTPVHRLPRVVLCKPKSHLEFALFIFAAMSVAAESNVRVFINNAEELTALPFHGQLTDMFRSLNVGSIFCFGSNRIFTKDQVKFSESCDVNLVRKEIPLKSYSGMMKVTETPAEDEEHRFWFTVKVNGYIDNCLFPLIPEVGKLFNTSLQTLHIVQRLVDSHAQPAAIFNKIRALD